MAECSALFDLTRRICARVSLAQTANRAVERRLADARDNPAVALRMPPGDEGVHTFGDGLIAADELRLLGPAAILVLIGRGDGRDRRRVDRNLSPLEGARSVAQVD